MLEINSNSSSRDRLCLNSTPHFFCSTRYVDKDDHRQRQPNHRMIATWRSTELLRRREVTTVELMHLSFSSLLRLLLLQSSAKRNNMFPNKNVIQILSHQESHSVAFLYIILFIMSPSQKLPRCCCCCSSPWWSSGMHFKRLISADIKAKVCCCALVTINSNGYHWAAWLLPMNAVVPFHPAVVVMRRFCCYLNRDTILLLSIAILSDALWFQWKLCSHIFGISITSSVAYLLPACL